MVGKDETFMNVIIYTDGAARGNPDGPGGYGAIIQYRDENGILMEKELSGGYPRTTNNRMELMGVISALEALGQFQEPCQGQIYSDSRYVVDAFEKHWITNWQKNGWVTSSKTPVKNQDLWTRLLAAIKPHKMRFHWVKGHADLPGNERCDRLATAAADKVGWSFDDTAEPFHSVTEWRPAGDGSKTAGEAGAEAAAVSTGAASAKPAAEVPKAKKKAVSREAAAAPCAAASYVPEPSQTIRIRYISDQIEKLQPPDNSSNWIDLRSAEDVELKKGDFRLIRLGVAMKLPKGYEAHLVPRSSTYKNFGIIQANHHGVVDNAYSGDGDEWRMPVIALRDTHIHVNDRICQFRIERRQPDIIFEEVEHLGGDDRGGFGSTGIR